MLYVLLNTGNHDLNKHEKKNSYETEVNIAEKLQTKQWGQFSCNDFVENI